MDANTVLLSIVEDMCTSLSPVWKQFPALAKEIPIKVLRERLLEEIKVREEMSPQTLKKHTAQLGISQQQQQQQKTQQSVNLTVHKETVIRTENAEIPKWQIEDNIFSHEFIDTRFGNGKDTYPNVISIGDYLHGFRDNIPGVSNIESLFSKGISASLNYGYNSHFEPTSSVEIFGKGFKPLSLCLLIEDLKTQELQLRFLLPDEGGLLWELLERDKSGKVFSYYPKITEYLDKKWISKTDRDYRLALVQPNLGIVQQGSDRFSKEIRKDPRFIALMTEAKFWNGELYYNKQEQEYLKDWIERVGAKNLENLMLYNILKLRPQAQRNYEGSTLQKLIHKATA